MIRLLRSTFSNALIVACIASGSAAAVSDPAAHLVIPVEKIEASESMSWSIPFVIENGTAAGIYLDSLVCESESLDLGETREARLTRFDVPGAARLTPSVSAGDTGRFQYELRATSEHARLTFHLYAHQVTLETMELTASVEALPGPGSTRYPSQFLLSGGKRVEYVFVPAESGAASAPGLLLIHGHGSHARTLLSKAIMLSHRGYAVMAASMPGYGQSDGPADYLGPATQQAMMRALDRLKRTPGVDSTRLAVWGVSRGAGVAMSVVEQRADLRCAIAQSGIYDLWAVYRSTTFPGIRENIVAEAGRDSAAWRARSPALSPEKVKAPVLFLHGERDPRVPVAQAREFFDALKARGAHAEGSFFPGAEHSLPSPVVDRAVMEFLTRQLKP